MRIEYFGRRKACGLAAFVDDVTQPSQVTVRRKKSEAIFAGFFALPVNKAGLALSMVDLPTFPLRS
jgi:hypothetical protein